jgi:PAS domain S-box-containing protein
MSQPNKKRGSGIGVKGQREEMTQSDPDLKHSFEQAPVGVYLADVEGDCIYANRELLDMVGLTLDEVIGKKLLNTVHPDDREPIVQAWSQVHDKDAVFDQDCRLMDKNDKAIWVHALASKRTDAQGNLVGYLGLIVDISRRKQAETSLEESEQKLRLLADHISQVIYMYDPAADKFQYVSPAYETIWGEPVQAVYSDPLSFARKVHPHDLPAFQEAVRKEHEEGIFFDLEYRIQPRRGVTRWIHSLNKPVFDEKGRHFLTVGIAQDITARKSEREALAQREEQFRLIAENSKEMIWQISTTGKVVFISPSVRDITGYSPEEVYGRKYREIVAPPAIKQALRLFKIALSGEEFSLVEIDVLNRDGGRIPIETSVTPIRKEGKVIGVQGIARDITRRRQAQQEHEALLARLSEAQQLANLGTWDWDLVADTEYWSDELFAIYGRDPKQGVPHPDDYSAQHHPDDRDKVHDALENSLSQGFAETEYRLFRHDDKSERTVRMRCRVENGPNGLPARQLGTIIDITEQKQREQELNRLLSDLNKAQSVSHVGSWRWDVQANTLEWSDEMYRIFGIDHDEFTGNLADIIARAIHPDDVEAVEISNRSVIEKGQPIPLEYRIIRPDGEIRTVWAEAGQLVKDTQGKPAYLTGVVMDITDRKLAEIKMAQSQQRYSSLIEDTPLLISRWLPDGTLTFVNRAYCEFFGKKPDALIGTNIFAGIPSDEIETVRQTIASVSPQDPVQTGENRVIRQDGQARWMRWTDRAFFDENGNITHYQSFGTDIHDRRLAEEERDRLLVTLQEAQRIAHIGSWEWDIPNDIYYWSDELFRIYGRDPQQGVPAGLDHVDVIHPDDLALMRAAKKESLITGLYECEYRLFRYDNGQERIVSAVGEVEFSKNEKPIRQRGTLRDVTEIRKAENALKESEENNRRLVDSAGLGIGYYDLDGIILRMNRVACKLMQTQEAQLIGRSAVEVFGNEMGRKILDRIALAVRHDTINTYEDQASLPSGTKWFRSTYNAVKNEHGKKVGVQVISEDISIIKTAELELAKSQAILENFSDAVIRTDLEGKITFWNRGAEKIFGYRVSEALAKPISILWRESDIPELDRITDRLRDGDDVHDLELTAITKDRQLVPILLSLLPLKDAGGEVVELVGFSKDISSLKQAQSALQHSERILSTLMGNLPGMAYRCLPDPDWTMRFISQGCAQLTGYEPEELLNNARLSFGELIHPDDRAAVHRQIGQAITNASPFELTYRIHCKDGTEKWVWEKGELVSTADNQPQYLEGFISDITGRVTAEQTVRDHADFLDTIMEQNPFSMFITDPSGIITRTNRSLREKLNLSDSQIVGKYNVLKDHNLVEQGVMPQVEAVFEKKEPCRFRILWKAQNTEHVDFSGGADLWIDAALFPIVDEHGSIRNVVCKWVDISEQVKATDALRESQRRYQSVVEDSPVLISRFKPDGIISFTNSAYSQFFTGQAEGMINQNIFDFILPSHHDAAREYLASFSLQNAIRVYDDQVKRHDGVERWLRWTDRALFDQDGNISEYQAFGEDITEQKEYEIALQASEQRYQSVVEDAPLMIIRYLPDGTITFTNSHYRQFYLEQGENLPWKNIFDKYGPQEKKQIKQELAKLTPMQPIRHVESLFERCDGQLRCLRWKDVALFDDKGKLLGYQAFGEDIHEQYIAEQIQKESERDLNALMGNLPGIAYRAEAHGRYIFQFLSQGCKELTGYEPLEFLDDPDFMYEMIMVEEYTEPLIEKIRFAVEHKTAFEISYRIITKSGEEKWVWERGSVVLDEAGDPHHIEGFITDITERVLAQAKLAESEARFRTFMDNFPANAYIKNENLEYIFVNKVASSAADLLPEEYIGRKSSDIFPPETAHALEVLDKSVLEQQIIIEKEDYLQTSAGMKRYLRNIKFPINGLHGEKLVGGIGLDLTAQKAAEERILEKARFEQLLAQISTTFLNMEPDHIDAGINNALKEIGGVLDIDRIAVSRVEQGRITRLTHIWSEKELKGVRSSYDIKHYPWLFSTSVDGETVIWSVNDGLPGHLTKTERDFFRISAVRSLVSLPIQSVGATIGSIIFSDYEDADKFTPELVESLHLFAQIISNAITLRDAQREIRESEVRYRSVVEDSPVLINRYRPDGTITYSNPAYCAYFGKNAEELVGQKIFDLMPLEIRSDAKKRISSMSKDNASYTNESKANRHDGQERWVQWTARALINTNGEVESIQSFGLDVTDQHLAAERIAASERQFRSLFTEMANGFSLFEVVRDKKGKPVNIAFVEVNPAFEDITGLRLEDITSKTITEVLPDFDRGWLQDYLDIALNDRALHRKDFNQRLGIHTDIRAFSPRAGQVAVLLTDITEQETLQDQIEQERDRAQDYLDTVQSIMIAMDSEGSLTLINPKACELLGYTEQELLGKNWFDTCLPRENIAEIKDVFQKIVRGEMESVQYYENPVRTRLGQQPIIAWHNAVMKDRDGNFLGVLSAGEDITARKAAEKRFNTLFDISTKLIMESYDQDMLQGIADEVRNRIDAAQAVTIWLYNPGPHQLTIQAIAGFEDASMIGLTIAASEGVAGQVAISRQARLVHHAQRDQAFTTVGGFTPEMSRIQCLMCAPLVFKDRLLGVICVDNFDTPQALTAEDLSLVESIANQLAGVVENAILFEQLQQSQAELRSLSTRLLEVQEEERRLVALDLHDHFGQILTTFKLSLRPEAFIKHSEAEQRARLAEVTAIVDELIEAAEDLSLRLRPAILDDLGVATAFEWHIQRFSRQAHLPIHAQILLDKRRRFAGNIEITLFRVLEESLSNALRHGDPASIHVNLRADQEYIHLSVQDDGSGFSIEDLNDDDRSQTGLTGMQERVRLLNGEFIIHSVPQIGTTIEVKIPLIGEGKDIDMENTS